MENINKVVVYINNSTELNIFTSFLDCISIVNSAGNKPSNIHNNIVIYPLYGIINDNIIEWYSHLDNEHLKYDAYSVIPFIEKFNITNIRCAYIPLSVACVLKDSGFNDIANSAYAKPRLNPKQYPSSMDVFIKYHPEHKSLYDVIKLDSIYLFGFLIEIRNCYRNGWVPDFTDTTIKHGIKCTNGTLRKIPSRNSNNVFSFQTREERDLFYICFFNELCKIKEFL